MMKNKLRKNDKLKRIKNIYMYIHITKTLFRYFVMCPYKLTREKQMPIKELARM